MTRCSTPPRGLQVVERALVAPADERLAGEPFLERLVRIPARRDPFAVLAPSVIARRMDGRGDVRGQRPRRGRPDRERLPRPVLEREPDEERRVDAVLVAADELVRGDRGSAARAPLGRAVSQVEPALLVHPLEEAPDVLDVRVGERVVVVAPVHPLPQADAPARDLVGRPHDLLAAAAGELGEAVLLDLVLRVQAQLALDADLDPEALAVEAVLVALVEAAQRLVALEDVLERAAPRRVHAEGLVRGDGTVHEAPDRAAAVTLAHLLEGLPLLPPGENLLF